MGCKASVQERTIKLQTSRKGARGTIYEFVLEWKIKAFLIVFKICGIHKKKLNLQWLTWWTVTGITVRTDTTQTQMAMRRDLPDGMRPSWT